MDEDNATAAPPAGSAEAKLLEAVQQMQRAQESVAHTAVPSDVPSDGPSDAAASSATLFGMSMTALMLNLVISTIGIGCLRYARSTQKIILVLPGLVFLVVPFFVTSAWALFAVFVGTTVATFFIDRHVKFG